MTAACIVQPTMPRGCLSEILRESFSLVHLFADFAKLSTFFGVFRALKKGIVGPREHALPGSQPAPCPKSTTKCHGTKNPTLLSSAHTFDTHSLVDASLQAQHRFSHSNPQNNGVAQQVHYHRPQLFWSFAFTTSHVRMSYELPYRWKFSR